MSSPPVYRIKLGERFKRDLKAACKKHPDLRAGLEAIIECLERGDRCGADQIPGYPNPETETAYKLRVGTKKLPARSGYRLIFFEVGDAFYLVRFYAKNEISDISVKDALAFLARALATADDSVDEQSADTLPPSE